MRASVGPDSVPVGCRRVPATRLIPLIYNADSTSLVLKFAIHRNPKQGFGETRFEDPHDPSFTNPLEGVQAREGDPDPSEPPASAAPADRSAVGTTGVANWSTCWVGATRFDVFHRIGLPRPWRKGVWDGSDSSTVTVAGRVDSSTWIGAVIKVIAGGVGDLRGRVVGLERTVQFGREHVRRFGTSSRTSRRFKTARPNEGSLKKIPTRGQARRAVKSN